MILEVNTPAFLFSTISLLMSAYAGRFSKISKIIRKLSVDIHNSNLVERHYLKEQISLFSKRIIYIRRLQLSGISSLFCSSLSMFFLLFERINFANIFFVLAIIFFLLCLLICLIEIYYSIRALELNLEL
ncbi:hypothetical protein U472_10640 [Orenia metallireducens]|uniref:DUF2721 domain-containing protein n=1 Tax=Orenia metallireducens TaxID=1413210 RepID=A0A1C0A8A8_9FIRM|nr:DUF2721 domain-containing protein [Orenia metallireducens]OCL26450.1 hypothetical protein U472_10640 [Orenia metallireducens]